MSDTPPSDSVTPGSMSPDEMSNEEIRVELSNIAVTLHDDPPHDVGPLIERREALRNEVRSRPATPADVENLQRELVGLKKRIGIVDDERINPAAMNDSDSALDTQAIAWSEDEATGRAAIESRIAHIQRRLADVDATDGDA